MIRSMEVLNTQPDILELPLGDFMPSHAAVQVRNIDGLGPVKGAVSSTPFATGRGDLFQGISVDKRNIVITFGLNPDWEDQTISSLRHLLYRYFSTGFWSELRFLVDELPQVVNIRGVSESFEPNVFSQDPEMQVSLICPKPDFLDLEATFITGSTIDITGVDFDEITYENLTAGDVEDVDYIGTAPSGFELRIELASGSYSGPLAFVMATPDGVQVLEVEGVLINSSQRFELNTVRSFRYVYNVQTGTELAANILAKMDKVSDWPEFSPGACRFAVYADAELTWELGYFNRYSGI